MEHTVYLSVALVCGVVALMIGDKVMGGFAIGVVLMVCLYNFSTVARWLISKR